MPDDPDGDALAAARRGRPSRSMRHAYAPYSDYPVGAAGAGRRRPRGRRLQRRERGVRRRRCAPSAAWSRQLHATGGGRLTHVVCVDGDGDGDHAVRALPPAAVRERRPELLLLTVSGRAPMDEVLPDAFGPDDLDA